MKSTDFVVARHDFQQCKFIAGLPEGAKPIWFFAPDQIRKKEWGPDGIEKRFSAAWSGFAPMLDQWLTVTEGRGRAAIREAYLDTLNGRVPTELGHILALAE